MKAHLLYRDQDFDFSADLPPNHQDLLQDLELTGVLDAMASGDNFLLEVAQKVMLASLTDLEAITYRQAVLADCMAQPDVIKDMYSVAVDALKDRRGLWGYNSQFPTSILSGAVSQLEAFVVRLRQLRHIADEHGAKFASEGMRTLVQGLERDLDDEYFELIRDHLKRLRFRGGELISAELDRDNSGINLVLRSTGTTKPRWKEWVRMAPRSSYSFTVPPRDEAGGQALSDLTNRGTNLVANAAAQSADHILSYFQMLRGELGFYIACLNLLDRLSATKVPISFPEPEPWQARALSAAGLRDVSLTLRAEGRVVGNDLLADTTSLVVVTGANSGGKSTFLRSVGQAQIMTQCGMFVTAEVYSASVCEGVFTHFIREEDATMTSGRLDEELSRMNTIADQIGPRCLMLFNESFAATNEREGSEIGRQVVRALLEADVKVLFVTHQYDFAQSFRAQDTYPTLFLRAERQPDGTRNFKLVEADPLPTSFGEDLYQKLGGWSDDNQDPGDVWVNAVAVSGD